jgi:hypothetical protein
LQVQEAHPDEEALAGHCVASSLTQSSVAPLFEVQERYALAAKHWPPAPPVGPMLAGKPHAGSCEAPPPPSPPEDEPAQPPAQAPAMATITSRSRRVLIR